jgi:uncharacterized protein YjbI with pentapeptide repeats
LGGANLFNADLRGANLLDAGLTNALVTGANFAGANLLGVDGLSSTSGSAFYDANTTFSLSFDPVAQGWTLLAPAIPAISPQLLPWFALSLCTVAFATLRRRERAGAR